MKLLIFLLTFLYSSMALGQTARSSGDNVVDRTLGKSTINMTETGTWTPVLVADNGTAPTGNLGMYTRIGNMVIGSMVLGTTVGGTTDGGGVLYFSFTLPIPSNFTSAYDLNGVVTTGGLIPAPRHARVIASTSNLGYVQLINDTGSDTGAIPHVIFTYFVK